MSAKHTPGPWQFAEAESWKDCVMTSKEYFVRRPDDDVAIASEILNPEDRTPSEANARLIAAAPDMLAALEECVESIESGLESDGNGRIEAEWSKADKAICSKARAAIAKAKGGQP